MIIKSDIVRIKVPVLGPFRMLRRKSATLSDKGVLSIANEPVDATSKVTEYNLASGDFAFALRESGSHRVLVSTDDGDQVELYCTNHIVAKSWIESFACLKQMLDGKTRERVRGGDGDTESEDVSEDPAEQLGELTRSSFAQSIDDDVYVFPEVKYDPVDDVAHIHVFERRSSIRGLDNVYDPKTNYIQVNGGYSFGHPVVAGVAACPCNFEYRDRRMTLCSSQALLLLWRDADVLWRQDQHVEAAKLLREHLDLATLVYGEGDYRVATSMLRLADVYSSMKRHKEAEGLLTKAAKLGAA